MARKSKLRRNGRPVVVDVRHQAWERITQWVAAGYSPTVIAGLAGVRRRTADGMANDARAGRARLVHHSTARRIMDAADRPTGGGGWVPSTGTVRRLQALTVMGWSMADLAERCDVAESTLHALRDPKHRTTRPKFAAAVERLYDELADKEGNCRYAGARARNRGWLPPAAWDDPDTDPQPGEQGTDDVVDEVVVERAMNGDPVTLTDTERAVALERLAAAGHSDREIGRRLHVCDQTILRWRTRLGIQSGWAA
ncbi:helix-turn-helix domain-containing protein [Phycicoccus sp. 3266]|uniref:helix-turn-helix domain-containing protein n=1 Tax=Phycicoccus sp. 3266 TaxID=2817751 RepID=UPI002858D235|nr:helix-turn-helix domain-containing protein [Phycicoccus sp. 3266]MDR6861950.1 DNA-binding CsgD family transcriptional regulator [Phycicoccus sp. 3266]